MQTTAVHSYLQTFRANGTDEKNVISQGSIQCKAGKWLIPNDKYDDFLQKINSELVKDAKRQMHFLESPNQKYNIIKIDIDLRFKPSEEELKNRCNFKRRYDDKFIEVLTNCIAENITEIIDINDNYNIYIQEKTAPRITHENTIKDGIHIIIPDIVMCNSALHYLRSKIIENDELKKLIKKIGNTSSISDVVDERIIDKNAWYVYGCGKPEDQGNYYKVTKIYKITKKDDEYIMKKEKSTKTNIEYIKLFSNFNKTPNVEYIMDFDDNNEKNPDSPKYSKEGSFGNKEKIDLLRSYTQNQTNYRRISSLNVTEIKPFLYCLKKERADDYNDWRCIGLCLYNMDDRNYEPWRAWSAQSEKYDENACIKVWYSEYPKFNKYNMGLNKLKEMARKDNPDEYKNIININKKNFFDKWIYDHAKETHIKTLSISTLSTYTKTYIKDYANFNVACACPGMSPIWYKFDKHKWTEDKAANKIYMLMTDELQKEITLIHEELKTKVFSNQTDEQQLNTQRIIDASRNEDININENNDDNDRDDNDDNDNDGNDDDDDDNNNRDDDNDEETVSRSRPAQQRSAQRPTQPSRRTQPASRNNRSNDRSTNESDNMSFRNYIQDDRELEPNLQDKRAKHFENQHNKACLSKCGEILAFLSTPQNKKKIIEDLSQKCYDEEFYTNLDENHNIFVCNNGVLDLETCTFRDGEPDDMMTISCKKSFPMNVDSFEGQEIIQSIQEWLDRILPIDAVQEYVLNIFALKLSGDNTREWFQIFTGSGANGKSQFFKMIRETFGEYYKQFDNCLLNTAKRDANAASPAVASLKGCRIAVTTEPKGGQPFESDKVKELIGGDELIGRHLNKDLIRFIPQYMMSMLCNDIPRNESTDDGFWRKIFVIPMPSKFISREEDMYKLNDPEKYPYHFKAENQEHLYKTWAPYLLYIFFERYKALKENDFKITIPDQVKIAIKEYMDEASTYTQFFNDKIIECPGYKIDANTLYSEFQLFVGRDFKTQKPIFLKQMERFLGKPKGRSKEFHGFKIHGSSGDLIEEPDEVEEVEEE